MDYLKEFLRLVHIVGGAFWYGSAILMGFFISPTVSATGEAGQKFIGYLVKNKGITKVIATAAGLTVLAGGILYWIDSDGLSSAWTRSGPGLVFGIGGIFGMIQVQVDVCFELVELAAHLGDHHVANGK